MIGTTRKPLAYRDIAIRRERAIAAASRYGYRAAWRRWSRMNIEQSGRRAGSMHNGARNVA